MPVLCLRSCSCHIETSAMVCNGKDTKGEAVKQNCWCNESTVAEIFCVKAVKLRYPPLFFPCVFCTSRLFLKPSRFLKHQREIEKRAAGRGTESTSLTIGAFNFRAVSGLKSAKRQKKNYLEHLSASERSLVPTNPQCHSMSQRVGAFSTICCEAVRSARRIAPDTDTWKGNVTSTSSSGGRVTRGTSASWPSKRPKGRWIDEERERWGMIETDQVKNVSGFEQRQPAQVRTQNYLECPTIFGWVEPWLVGPRRCSNLLLRLLLNWTCSNRLPTGFS